MQENVFLSVPNNHWCIIAQFRPLACNRRQLGQVFDVVCVSQMSKSCGYTSRNLHDGRISAAKDRLHFGVKLSKLNVWVRGDNRMMCAPRVSSAVKRCATGRNTTRRHSPLFSTGGVKWNGLILKNYSFSFPHSVRMSGSALKYGRTESTALML